MVADPEHWLQTVEQSSQVEVTVLWNFPTGHSVTQVLEDGSRILGASQERQLFA